MSGKIDFIGGSPFNLPVIQSAEAHLMGEHVEMTLRIALPNVPQLSEIKAQMLHGGCSISWGAASEASDRSRAQRTTAPVGGKRPRAG